LMASETNFLKTSSSAGDIDLSVSPSLEQIQRERT
jgi:DUF4097 and DUF4098 domain-containing protein YvlB